MTQVFISYKSEYRDFAERLRDHLRAWGFGTWLDVDNIQDGYWRDAIDSGLRQSEIVVGVLTPEALESREVKLELNFPISKGKRLVLLKYRACDLPYWLDGFQYIDFTRDEASALEQLRQALAAPDTAGMVRAPPYK